MKPDVPSVLIELAGLVARCAAPGLDDAERAGNLGLTAALLGIAVQAWDATGHNLITENRALRRLLDEPQTPEDDFRLSVLAVENARLRAALISFHAEIEGQDDPREAAVWTELRASTERRLIASGLS